MSTRRQVDMPELTEEQFRIYRAREALHRDGASPAGALELLASLVEDRTWERVADANGCSYTGRFREFVKAPASGLGYDPEELPKVAQLRHPLEGKQPAIAKRMEAMRAAVEVLLREEIERAPEPGEIGRGRTRVRATHSNADTVVRTVARLKRDDPALAARVVRGEITPNAAARQKGWRKPRVVVSSPESVAVSLRKYMTTDDIARLIALLMREDL